MILPLLAKQAGAVIDNGQNDFLENSRKKFGYLEN
jgi:hypothetical protein